MFLDKSHALLRGGVSNGWMGINQKREKRIKRIKGAMKRMIMMMLMGASPHPLQSECGLPVGLSVMEEDSDGEGKRSGWELGGQGRWTDRVTERYNSTMIRTKLGVSRERGYRMGVSYTHGEQWYIITLHICTDQSMSMWNSQVPGIVFSILSQQFKGIVWWEIKWTQFSLNKNVSYQPRHIWWQTFAHFFSYYFETNVATDKLKQ